MAGSPRRRARRVFGYWRSEQRTLRQGFVALLVSTLAALVAGVTTASILSTRRGYDLDTVSTPLVTAAGDMVTVPTLFLATFIAREPAANAIVAGLCIAVCLYATVRGALTDLPLARRAVLEMVGVIALTPLL